MVTVIPRSQWGARYPDGRYDRPRMPVTEFWLHHSVTVAPDLVAPFTDDDQSVRRLEAIGQQRFGCGISYTYAATPVGRLYEGHSIDRVGAHTKGPNEVGAAFVLVGDYSNRTPTAAQQRAIAEQMVSLHRSGKATRHTLNGGHRQASGNSTACPGDAGLAAVATINALAERLWSGAEPKPKPPTTPAAGVLQYGDTGDRVRALQAGLRRVFPAYAGRLAVDGSYGAATRAAVTEFQRRAKAQGRYADALDGIAGPNTRAALATYGIVL